MTLTRGAGLHFGGTWFPVVGTAAILIVSAVRLMARVPLRRVLPQALFAVYAVFVIDFALLPVDFEPGMREMHRTDWLYWQRSVNLVPFRTVIAQLSPEAPPTAVAQIIGNVALLFPFGVLAPAVFPGLRRLGSLSIAAICVTAGIELLQLLQKVALIGSRSIDVDDVILNTAGALLGFLVWRNGQSLLAGLGVIPSRRQAPGIVVD